MKIKRKALSILSCFALLVSSIPSTTVFVSAEDYTSATEPVFEEVGSSKSPCVFANGTPITVKTEDGKVVVEYSFGGQTKKLGEDGNDIPENVTIFGGSHKTEGTLQSSEVIIDGVKVHGVFGGGLHKSHVETATVTVKGNADLDFVQGGGASSYKGLVDQCQWYSGDTANATTKVDNATVKIEGNECNIDTVFGGGEGISYTGTTNVTVEGGNITFVGAGGSNGYTGAATVEINGGTIGKVQSVNRGTMDSAAFDVSGGTIEKFYIGGEKEDSTVTGTITKATVNIKGGKVNNMYPGTSGGSSSPVDTNNTQNFSVEVSSEAEVGLDETLQKSDILTCKHNLERVEGTPAECEKTGTAVSWKCKNCKKLFRDAEGQDEIDKADVIKALGHKWSDWKAIDKNSNKSGEYTPVTCTKDGWQYIECSQCGAEEYREVEALGHNWADDIEANRKNWTKKTCTTDGTYQLECTVCHELSKPITEKHEGHKETTSYEAIAPTCKATGRNAYVYCKVCDKVISINGVELETPATYEEVKDQIIVALDENAHRWGDWEVTKKPTCNEKGEEKRICELCHKEETKEIDNNSIAHQWDDWEVTKKPTCNEKGEEKRTCELCHKEETKEIDNNFIAHQWDDWEVIKEPTCNEKGEEKRTCELCHKEETKEIDKNPSAHKYKNDGICQLCGQKVLTQSGSNVTTSKDTSKNNKKNEKIVKIINSRNKTKVKIKKKKIIIKFSRRGGCKYRIKIYNKKNKEISLKVKQDYMKGNGKKKFKKFYQIKKKGDYRIEIYELKGMKEKNFKDVKCIYLNYKTIK